MDVITFGEAMVRLAPADNRRLEQAYTLDIEIGGAELNTAVGLSRLGRQSAWVSRLTENALGRLIANRAREQASSRTSSASPRKIASAFTSRIRRPHGRVDIYDRAIQRWPTFSRGCLTGQRSSLVRAGSMSPGSQQLAIRRPRSTLEAFTLPRRPA